jgi:spermidine dehydrogenase
MADDDALGMGKAIDRRDFLNGVAVGVGVLGSAGAGKALAEAAAAPWPQDVAGYFPPVLTGMRGSHPGSFENAHKLRDGDFWQGEGAPRETGETYDLIVVGGGISGLSAAYFFRKAKPNARILILYNHDDFGGHAKRN